MKKQKIKKLGKKVTIVVTFNADDLARALGRVKRQEELGRNPHGFAASKKIHKSKKSYSRKGKKDIW